MTTVGFETTTPVFKRAKTFHALGRAATMIDLNSKSFIYVHFKLIRLAFLHSK
jgi:hypothetical protein